MRTGTLRARRLPRARGGSRILPPYIVYSLGAEPRVDPVMATILVVDDDPDVRTLLEAYLQTAGYEVVTASNGQDALRRLSDAQPSLILLDLMMPVMDGEEFLRHQKRQPAVRDIPVVCLSARHDAKQAASRMGLADCLGKPFDLDAVLTAVRRHCPA
jgi:CheY-like chemotaxis protein